jgi:class 3 adenylate cyclase
LNTAEKSNAVVASLFPADVRDRLLQAQQEETKKNSKEDAFRVKGLDGSQGLSNNYEGSPIAQLYPDTTVLFADISGFTAWSSSRQPSEVFHLLESAYNAFDKIAHDHDVFKVETIGDSYVAVCGLPKPRKNHAVVMARFAAECQEKAVQTFIDLESSLGPGTADLSFRFGLNSGRYHNYLVSFH